MIENITRSDYKLFYEPQAPKVKCSNCDFEGNESQLHFFLEDKVEVFKGCPNCQTDEFLSDYEDEEQVMVDSEKATMLKDVVDEGVIS